ncbi:unnamed protein product [Vicia faba]|uniref:Uncharacterized protein n=1 Tax=Vicia faba TaxID=3906 RepID=A0AAV0ZA68_VICFA|nr:unnamed protein product [Vicia faba]
MPFSVTVSIIIASVTRNTTPSDLLSSIPISDRRCIPPSQYSPPSKPIPPLPNILTVTLSLLINKHHHLQTPFFLPSASTTNPAPLSYTPTASAPSITAPQTDEHQYHHPHLQIYQHRSHTVSLRLIKDLGERLNALGSRFEGYVYLVSASMLLLLRKRVGRRDEVLLKFCFPI